jgi:hypothetical protein
MVQGGLGTMNNGQKKDNTRFIVYRLTFIVVTKRASLPAAGRFTLTFRPSTYIFYVTCFGDIQWYPKFPTRNWIALTFPSPECPVRVAR